MRAPPPSRVGTIAIAAGELLALAVWGGGLGALGAIVAPVVFHTAPAPTNAQVMTQVFSAFDDVTIVCAVVALLAEAALVMRSVKMTPFDGVRVACIGLAAVLALAVGGWLSPAISDLHRAGAVRGQGEAGVALEHFHRYAETFAKGQLELVAIAIVLVVERLTRVTSQAA